MQRELKAIQQRLGTTFVHVTHDQEEAMAIADTVVVMQAGRVADAGPPDRVYLRPANAFTAGFMGEINLLPARIEATGPDGTVLDTPLGRCQVLEPPPAGPQLRIGVRPEQLKLAVGRSDEEATMVFEAAVIESVFAGPHQRARLQIADGTEIVAQLPQSFAAAPEARVSLQLKTSDLILLSDSEA
ncbi:MAG: TOBE domain-containing protein [Pseudomonadota bacterium]